MKSARRVPALIVWSLMFPFMVAALGAVLQVGTPEPSAATPIEQALIEHVCSVAPSGMRFATCLPISSSTGVGTVRSWMCSGRSG